MAVLSGDVEASASFLTKTDKVVKTPSVLSVVDSSETSTRSHISLFRTELSLSKAVTSIGDLESNGSSFSDAALLGGAVALFRAIEIDAAELLGVAVSVATSRFAAA